ncbi:MAG: DUF1573 domain-containing protein [Bacteroidales bacterium]|nr:DUF1573 domain-containing protein [Bacteroidales bacterium]
MKIKKAILSFCLLCMAPVLYSQFTRPTIAFETSEHDFGNVYESEGTVSVDFEFTNTGKVPVILQNVHASCGCASPEWTKEPVVPGQDGRIKVTFNPKNRPGPFTKTITVTSNAEPAVKTLTIKGTVIPVQISRLVNALGYKYTIGDLKLQKVHASFGDVLMGRDDTVSINLINTSADKTLHLGFLKIPDHLTVHFIPDSIPPNDVGKIHFVFSSVKRNDWDYVIDRLHLMINGELLPNNTISLTANVKEDFSTMTAEQFSRSPVVSFDATVFDFGYVTAGTRVEHDFVMTNKGKSNLYVRKLSASCGCTAVQPSKTVIAPGESTEIKVLFNTKGRNGADKKAITVITNDPRQSKTILWIKAFVENPVSQTP